MQWIDKTRFSLGVCCLSIVVLCGCTKQSPTFYPVEGAVLLDGKAVPGATVSFISQTHEGIVGSGTTDGHGVFTISSPVSGKIDSGLPLGEYFVIVAKKEIKNAPRTPKELAAVNKENENDEKKVEAFVPEMVYQVPRKYESPQTSGLTATVKKENKSMVFNLKTEEEEKSEGVTETKAEAKSEGKTEPQPNQGADQ